MGMISKCELVTCKRFDDTDLEFFISQDHELFKYDIPIHLLVTLFDRHISFMRSYIKEGKYRYIAPGVFCKHGTLFDIKTEENIFFGTISYFRKEDNK